MSIHTGMLLVVLSLLSVELTAVSWHHEDLKGTASTSQANSSSIRGLKRLDLCDPNVEQDSGYINLKAGDRLFYWLFEAREDADNKPLTVYMYGGPGVSSLYGLFFQNGPCSLNADGSGTVPRKYSLTGLSNVVWVDQPAGTGFSRGQQVSSSVEAADKMYEFLQNFFKKYPKYSTRAFYLNGPSYAGHFIPALGTKIVSENKKGQQPKINLKGLIIGNGNANSAEIYKEYIPLLRKAKAVPEATLKAMTSELPTCLQLIGLCNQPHKDPSTCNTAYEYCLNYLYSPAVQAGVFPYDVHINCKRTPEKCVDPKNIDTFLARPEVRRQLQVNTDWIGDNSNLRARFRADRVRRYDTLLPEQIEAGVKVLNYAGDQDLICNAAGNANWMLNLEWKYKTAFNARPIKPFLGKAGTIRSLSIPGGGLFASVTIFGAGHFAEMDKPEEVYKMLQFFYSVKTE